jgi:hypothetical protein
VTGSKNKVVPHRGTEGENDEENKKRANMDNFGCCTSVINT